MIVQQTGGVVKNGVIVPDAPLPEGARVQIALAPTAAAIPPELQEELDAWNRASDKALDLVERLARGEPADEAR